MFRRAITRIPGDDYPLGLSATPGPIPLLSAALTQHAAYRSALAAAGLDVISLPPEPGFPDGPFVEDTAVVAPIGSDSVAVITRPGAPSRRGEEVSVAGILGALMECVSLEEPATLDGGDVLVAGKTVYAGISDRTNRQGVEQLAGILEPRGLKVVPVPVAGGLHLKSGVNLVAPDTILIWPEWAEREEFAGFKKLVVPAEERYAANCLWLGGVILAPAGFPGVLEMLDKLGTSVVTLEASEFAKLDGGLTCLSIRIGEA